MKKDALQAWEIFMKLCEEFPELYDKYIEKVENRIGHDTPDPRIMTAAKERCLKKLFKKTDNDF